MGDALPDTLKQLRDYAGQSSLEPMDWLKPVLVLGLLGLPMLVLGVICRRDRRPATAGRADVVFVFAWLAAELVGVVSQRRMYAYHFLPLAPPAALATGLIARQVRLRSITMAFGPFVAISAALAVLAYSDRPKDSRDDRVIAYVREHAGAAPVWADDYPRLLVETDCPAGSSVPLIFLMANGDDAPAFFGEKLLEDFERRRPKLIAFAADPAKVADLYRHHMADVAASPVRGNAIECQLKAIQTYLDAHYTPAADIGNVRIWQRRDASVGVSVAAGR